MVRRASTPAPRFGSAEFLALPDGDPTKVASVVVAAECWARGGDDLETDLQRELDAARSAHKQAEDTEYVARYQAHRAEWARRTPIGKTFTERRAEQLAAVEPRPGDFMGRGRGLPHHPQDGDGPLSWSELFDRAQPTPMCPDACTNTCLLPAALQGCCGVECRPTNAVLT